MFFTISQWISYIPPISPANLSRPLKVLSIFGISEDEISLASEALPESGPEVFNPQQQVPLIWPDNSADASR